jgi:uncharacterized membrane protein YoaK (UPF0700 family)
MATVPLEPDNRPPPTSVMDGTIVRRPVMPAIRWGAILAGVVVGISIQLVLTLLGIATGLTSASIAEGQEVGIGPLIWAGISMLIAAFIGAYVAARMSGLKRKADGVLHGTVSWAVTTLLFATLATSAAGSIMNNLFDSMVPNIGNNVATKQTTKPADQIDPVETYLVRQFGEDATPTHLRRMMRYIQAGDRDMSVRYMVESMNIAPLRSENIADQALMLKGTSDAASPRAKAEAERAVGTASVAAWTVFTVVALSLVLGIIGGALGAHGSRRTTWGGTGDVTPPSS